MYRLSVAPLLVGSLFFAVLLVGCGGGGESYEDVLSGLKEAANNDTSFNAFAHDEGLTPAQRSSLEAFCETNDELVRNKEAWKAKLASYLINRIKYRAERELPFVSTRPVNVAVGQYKELFGLDSFEPDAVRRYAKACYN